MPPPEPEERFIRIETQIAFQEHGLEELSDVVLEQGRQIAKLKKRVEMLLRQLEVGQRAEEEAGIDEDLAP